MSFMYVSSFNNTHLNFGLFVALDKLFVGCIKHVVNLLVERLRATQNTLRVRLCGVIAILELSTINCHDAK